MAVKYTGGMTIKGSRHLNLQVSYSPPNWTTGTTLPTGHINSNYSTNLVATTSGSNAITYSLTSGTLPSGVTLSANGALSGHIPFSNAAIHGYTFTVSASDGRTPTARTFSLTVAP